MTLTIGIFRLKRVYFRNNVIPANVDISIFVGVFLGKTVEIGKI